MNKELAIKLLRGSVLGTNEQLHEAVFMAIRALKAEPQGIYEQGVKDALDKYDETCRIVSEIRMAVGCKTAKECWELIRNGEIQRVKHGRWIFTQDEPWYAEFQCSECGEGVYNKTNFCPNCGADMRGE